jgi:hypothetical protein
MNRDTRAVLVAFVVGAVFGPALVWVLGLTLAAWAALLGGR